MYKTYTTDYILTFPASEYGGIMFWVASDLKHLELLIGEYIKQHKVEDPYYRDDDYKTPKELLDTVQEIEVSKPGLVAFFDT